MIMITNFFMICIIFIPCLFLKIEDIKKIIVLIVYTDIVYWIYLYYTDPLTTWIFNSIINKFTGNIFNLTGF